jgi:hypothetical protein
MRKKVFFFFFAFFQFSVCSRQKQVFRKNARRKEKDTERECVREIRLRQAAQRKKERSASCQQARAERTSTEEHQRE